MINEAGWDRGLRVLVGALTLWLAFFSGSLAGGLMWVAVVVGAALLVTGVVGFCPAYRIFGISTCRSRA